MTDKYFTGIDEGHIGRDKTAIVVVSPNLDGTFTVVDHKLLEPSRELGEPRSAFEQYKNPDGTYNGVKLMADLTGVSEAQIIADWESIKRSKANG